MNRAGQAFRTHLPHSHAPSIPVRLRPDFVAAGPQARF